MRENPAAGTTGKGAEESGVSGRLAGLDALRGFDMFWILGMEAVGAALLKVTQAPWAGAVAGQLEHAEWAGFRFLDLIFPLFVLVSGVSLVFSADKSVAAIGRRATLARLLKRAVLLYFLGFLAQGGLSRGWDEVRWLGVLQRLAVCGFAGGVAYLYLGRRARAGLLPGLLAGYWALMAWVPVPGFGAGDFREGHNLANWVDAQWLPGRKYDGSHDPEGLLSTLPAVGSALLGIFAGEWLKHGRGSLRQKAGGLVAAGAVLAVAGWAWHPFFPVIKKLWTSSFVLVAGGYSLALLALFLMVTDGWKLRRLVAPFIWIGMNPITLFLSHHVLNYPKVSRSLFGGPVAGAFGAWSPLVVPAGVVLLGIGLAWFLYSRKIFLRV